ncbi:DUF4296 domain-containing protein [Flavobacterium succinicans]|uniref:DUF4296 domain-containing protein n=1 Tax=Flavobacterium succinicans TaxID=29536 RepID=A0A199XPD1_9FLAO|nr:DUF4296 domain-containing protein [Flavobacterium succinicans]OAZ03598.1 hypothetical protein FLB_18740 [Flavobacterium succinicans]
MKKGILFFVLLVFFVGCRKEETVKTPKKLIDKAVMVNVFYDLAILDASKYQMMSKTEYQKIVPKEFIFKKYKIDSAQFSQSNIYYASSIEEYKAMFEQVQKRLQVNSDKMDTIIKRKQEKLKLNSTTQSKSRAEKLAQ